MEGWLRLCHTSPGTQYPLRTSCSPEQLRHLPRKEEPSIPNPGLATQEEKELFAWPVHTCFLFQVLIPKRKEKGSMFCTVGEESQNATGKEDP